MDGSDRTEENINHQYRQIEQRLNDFQQAITKLFDNFFKTGVKIICILVGSTPHKILLINVKYDQIPFPRKPAAFEKLL